MLSFHMQNLNASDLQGVIHYFIMGWTIFGIPSVIAIFGLSHLRIFRQLRWRSVVLLFSLVGLIFGLAAGYYNVCSDHCCYTEGGQEDLFVLFGEPGNFMAESYGGDWQSDEAWIYRADITLWNGLFWMSVMMVGGFVTRFSIRRRDSFEPPTPDKLPEPTGAVAVHVAK